jgi:7-keto-8-aminopelargonate synthetase-like enzyme
MSADLLQRAEEFLKAPRTVSAEEAGLAAEMLASVSPPNNAGPWITHGDTKFLQFSTNDYLGLASAPSVREKATEIVAKYGISAPMGSRTMTGTTADHLELEQRVAELRGCEAALVFATGASAMMGLLAALAKPGDFLFLDQYAHTSLVCGAKIAGATTVFFRHNDLGHLEFLLQQYAGQGPGAIVVDGVYSMQGTVAPLAQLADLKHRFGMRLIVDDAHGTGVFGEHGGGTPLHQDVNDEVDVQAGTFSKAIATIGGFVAGPKVLVDYLRYTAPTMLFTKSIPLAVVAATMESIHLLWEGDDLREKLHRNARRLQDGLKANGFDIGRTQSPITPIQFNGNEALVVAKELRETHRIWVSPILHPAVEMGKSIIRVIPTARHTTDDIDYLIESLMACKVA